VNEEELADMACFYGSGLWLVAKRIRSPLKLWQIPAFGKGAGKLSCGSEAVLRLSGNHGYGNELPHWSWLPPEDGSITECR